MKLSKQTHSLLKKALKKAEKEANSWIGKTLIWKINPSALGRSTKPFKGRKCVVKRAIFDEYSGHIAVVVKTYSSKGGFVDDNDMVHRLYRNLDTCFETIKD